MKTPGNGTNFIDCQVGAEAEEDTEGRPHLPTHDETTTDGCRHVLGGEDGHSGGFGAHADTKETTTCLREG